MKKLFTAFALGLLLVGCAREYDDSELRNRVTTLETKVGNLEANMKAIQTATNDGMFVQKVEELTKDGKVVGVTVTYTTGQVVTFEIAGAGAETNLSAIRMVRRPMSARWAAASATPSSRTSRSPAAPWS